MRTMKGNKESQWEVACMSESKVPINPTFKTVQIETQRCKNLPHISELLDEDLLEKMLNGKYIKQQKHPTLPLRILNYTQVAQFERLWNDVTLSCRGLIVDDEGNVVARPFSKFFNIGEHDVRTLPTGPVHVTDKLDGSLGILYPTDTGYAIATRGSFTSEQALHATKLYKEKYEYIFDPNKKWTYLFEIIYPKNQIVVQYNGLDDLVLLGAVDNTTGLTVPLIEVALTWPGPIVEQFPYNTLEEALSAPIRKGKEGLVVHFVNKDQRVKIKHEEYVRIHRIVTGVSERRIWEALSTGQDINVWLDDVPDEFYTFIEATRSRLKAEYAALDIEIQDRFKKLISDLPQKWTRKEFAAAVNSSDWPLSRALYNLLDGRDYSHLIWMKLRPAEHAPLFARNEDNS